MIRTNTVGSVETVEISGVANFVAGGTNATTVNVHLAAHSEWIGAIDNSFSNPVTVTGSGVFDNTSSFIDSKAIVGVDVIGTGHMHVGASHSQGNLIFLKSVSAGQAIDVTGGEYGAGPAILEVDRPGEYHASTTLGLGHVILEGLKASSYSLAGGVLSLFSGNRLVDAMRLALTAPLADNTPYPGYFTVAQVGYSVVLTNSLTPGNPTLPSHTRV